MQRSLSATYSARNSTISKTTDVSRCVCGDRRKKNSKFLRIEFCRPKMQFLEGVGWGDCTDRTTQMPQFRATRVISGASQHPKDMPFVREF